MPQGLRIPIATQLMLSFMLILGLVSIVFLIVGTRFIGERIVTEAQEKVRHDLNAAREIYHSELRHINDVIHLTAQRFFLQEALMDGDLGLIAEELSKVRQTEGLDILSLTDPSGRVILRSTNPGSYGDDLSQDLIIETVLIRKESYAGSQIISARELSLESQQLLERAQFTLVDTPLARPFEKRTLSDGLMMRAAAPVFDSQKKLIGVLYGGVLVNRDLDLVDLIKETVYADLTYENKDIGTATIFQDDVRISTNVRNQDGTRALGTRVSEAVYNQVVLEGKPWIGRAYVVNDWYITAYEPIRDLHNKIIGILYVGILEQKYIDAQNSTVLAFLAVTLLGTVVGLALSLLLAKRISVPIEQLAQASQEIAQGNLDTRVRHRSNNELGDLAVSFNSMAESLQERDQQLKEFAKSKIMESERLALVGQLAANVAHELNNPLQGIVTYSHLMLEKLPSEENAAATSLNRIVSQANRCRDIIRGLLDLSRQRKPDKTICDLNAVLLECLTLVEKQATFHNIEIVQEFDRSLPKVVVDPSQIQQVVLNLIINAAEAMDEEGRLVVSTHYEPQHEIVTFMVKDDGCGIPEEHLEKLFDPFFTTKEVGHGTGLGLAISYGIVKEHGGTIEVHSQLGQGTTFSVHLPLQHEFEA